jgi:tetratricopeptide (TPR) repeat protein
MNAPLAIPARNGVPEALATARLYQRAGDLSRATQLCQQYLQADPLRADAWHLLGDLARQQGKAAEALGHYEHALRLQPQAGHTRVTLGHLLLDVGRRREAVAQLRQAAQHLPDSAEAHAGLGLALAQEGGHGEAAMHLRTALRLDPGQPVTHHNLGVALAQRGLSREAVVSLREAIRLKPDYAEAYYNLGSVLLNQRQRAEAVTAFEEALRLRPDYADVYNNLGLALHELGRSAEAVVILRQAVRLRPTSAEAHNNLGMALAALGRFPEAEPEYQEALRLNPRYPEAHANLACAYHLRGHVDEAEAAFRLALWFEPQSPSARWNRSLLWLQRGKFAEGWAEYEWRWKRPHAPVYGGAPRDFGKPLWDGTAPEGRTLLLHMEQGLGDMIQFVRYARLLKDRGAIVVAECPAFLAGLFATCPGVDRVVAEGTPLPDFDAHVPLLSLPHLLATTLETIPAAVPYLFPDAGLVEEWRGKLAALPGMKVGVCWQGNPHHQWDRWRSLPLRRLAPLARVPGVGLVSVQRGPGSEQAAALGGRFPLTVPEWATDDFMETAAVMANLDLVITVDTAVAHLAGALGRPVWVLVYATPDWRWLFGRDDSPWYPTMQLFRQRRLGRWAPVIRRLTRELSRQVKARPNAMQPTGNATAAEAVAHGQH